MQQLMHLIMQLHQKRKENNDKIVQITGFFDHE